MWHSDFIMMRDDDTVEAKTASYVEGALIRLSGAHGGSISIAVSPDHARKLVKSLQALIDAEFGLAPADNVVTLQTGDAA